MIKYYVRTTNERVLDNSYNQIEYELLVDTEHNARKSFVEQLEELAKYDYDVVILEDDLILCKEFKERIEKIINKYPHMLINFFYAPSKYFKMAVQENFCWNQCVYYPNDILKKLAVEMRTQYELHPLQAHDEVENLALNNLKIKNLIYRPCLVQHLDNGSLVGNGKNYRRTPFFIDYLDELNIDYNDANRIDNRIKLKRLLLKKFKDL